MLAPNNNTAIKNPTPISSKWIIYMLLLIAIGVCAAILVVFILTKTDTKADTSTSELEKSGKKSPMTVETAPKLNKASQSQEKNIKQIDKKVEKKESPLPPQKPHEVRDGMLMLSNGTLIPTNKIRKVSIADRKPRFKYAIFKHSTDNELAAIITLKPGEALIGGPIRRKNYKVDFLKSIETPVIINENDPEDVKDVKRAVIDARRIIKDAIDRGEDPAIIIKDAYDEAQKFALYKDDLRREIIKSAKEGDYTEEELNDLIKAANVMLTSKGIVPITLGPIMRSRLKTLKR